jgi:phosphatidylinositol glycan class O
MLMNIIEKMDDHTTLIVFGDHGMTSDGNHGGSAEDEMRSVVFSYQKKPFPMYEKFKKYFSDLTDMNKAIKQVDLAAIVSVLLDIPFPYSNLGVFHPAFYPHTRLANVHTALIKNLKQMETYL